MGENMSSILRKVLLISAAAVALTRPVFVGVWIAPSLLAQEGAPLSFEIASVRPNKDGGARGENRYHPGGRFTSRNTTLKSLILAAYRIPASRLSGGPSWIESDGFDIEAKAPSGMFPPRQLVREETNKLDRMLQTLLADRFSLKLRREQREVPVYLLVVAKGGAKLQPPPKARDCLAPANDFSNSCHSLGGGARAGLRAQSADMDDFADVLSNLSFADRPVFNRTGLKGVFDFFLKWTPDNLQSPEAQQRAAAPNRGENTEVDPNGPNLNTAIQEQLGLRLEPQKGKVDFFFIESAEKPSEN
jgi:bla regulator protein blaR1